MAINPVSRAINPAANATALAALSKIQRIPNEIAGLGATVYTFGKPLVWHKQTVPQDASATSDKRDHFLKRSAFCEKVAEAGEFEYACAYSPKSDGMKGTKHYSVKCALCGAGHEWAVFYRRAADGHYLGHSGCDCFEEIANNLNLPAAAAVIKTAREEAAKAKKFVETINKINQFKEDFPGLYEYRERLRSYSENPQSRIWNEVEHQLSRANGIDEKFCAECVAGEWDRRGTYRGSVNRAARELPAWLKWASEFRSAGHTIDELLEEVRNRAGFKRSAPAPIVTPVQAPAPKPVHVHTLDAQQTPADVLAAKIKALDVPHNGWSTTLRKAAQGERLCDTEVTIIERFYERQVKAGLIAPVAKLSFVR